MAGNTYEICQMENPILLMRSQNAEWRGCTQCELYKTRIHVVTGVGKIPSPLAFVGEAPGTNEDVQATPFVGQSGELLNMMLDSAGVSRETVYITNVVKCHPLKNETPNTEYLSACYPKLLQELYLVEPIVVVALGATAASALLGKSVVMRNSVGHLYPVDLPGRVAPWRTTVLVTYHPAYIIRGGLKPEVANNVLEHIIMAVDIAKEAYKLGGDTYGPEDATKSGEGRRDEDYSTDEAGSGEDGADPT